MMSAAIAAALAPLQGAAPNFLQRGVLYLAVGILFILLLMAGLAAKYRRPDMDPRHAATILGQLRGFGSAGAGVVVRNVGELEDPRIRGDIRNQLDGNRVQQTRVRTAIGEVAREIYGEIQDRKPKVPVEVTRWWIPEALATLLFGMILFQSVDWWTSLTETESAVDLLPTIGELRTGAVDVGQLAIDGVLLFPFLPEFLSWMFAMSVTFATLFWSLYVLPPLALITLSVIYVHLDRKAERVRSEADFSGPGMSKWTARVAVAVLAAWITGAVVANVLILIPEWIPVLGTDSIAKTIGFLAAWIPFNWILIHYLRETADRWRRVRIEAGPVPYYRAITRGVGIAVGIATIPMTVGYAIAAIASGKFAEIASLIFYADMFTVGAVAFAVIAAASFIGFFYLSLFRDIREAIRRAFAIQTVRTFLFTRGIPWVTVLIAAVFIAALGGSMIETAGIALGTGLVVKIGGMGFNWAVFKSVGRPERDSTPAGASRVVIHARQLEDKDGNPLFVASVSGHRVAHRNKAALFDQIISDATGYLREGSPERGSFARYYYREGVRRGKPDMSEVLAELMGDIRTRLTANVQNGVSASRIMEILTDNYPDEVVSAVLTRMKETNRLTRREDRFILR